MPSPPHADTRALVRLCALGVGLRLLVFVLAGRPELVADEAGYVYSALYLDYFGTYADSFRYLWPPGYPFVLARGLELFGADGLEAVKLLQVAASASTGLFTMLLTRELYGQRAARIAGWMWCLYLPLIGFTHLLWTESLYLACLTPALYLLLRVRLRPPRHPERALVAAGVLLAASAYLREISLYLTLLLAVCLLCGRAPLARRELLRQASLLLLAFAVCVLPWTLRNASRYGHFIPLGTTLGENCYQGLNARHVSFDLSAIDTRRVAEGGGKVIDLVRPGLTRTDPAGRWGRALAHKNIADRMAEQTWRGIEWARAHPGDFARTRLRKLVELVAPHSFFLRHMAIGRYDPAPLGASWLRKVLTIWALLSPILLLPLAFAGLGSLPRGAGWWAHPVLLYFVATILIVSMSRFRVPLLPILFALAAGHLTGGIRWKPLLAWTLLLAGAWWVTLPEVLAVLELAWRPAA